MLVAAASRGHLAPDVAREVALAGRVESGPPAAATCSVAGTARSAHSLGFKQYTIPPYGFECAGYRRVPSRIMMTMSLVLVQTCAERSGSSPPQDLVQDVVLTGVAADGSGGAASGAPMSCSQGGAPLVARGHASAAQQRQLALGLLLRIRVVRTPLLLLQLAPYTTHGLHAWARMT